MLAQGSIGKEKDFKPFWNSYSEIWSKRLLLPTKTDCVDLPLSSCSSYANSTILNSWFTFTKRKVQEKPSYQKTYSQSSMFLWQKIMDCEQQKTKDKEQLQFQQLLKQAQINKCKHLFTKKQYQPKLQKVQSKDSSIKKTRKIQLKLEASQKSVMNRWFDASRFIYNECISCVVQNKRFATQAKLRKTLINSKSPLTLQNPWLLETPYDIKDQSIAEFMQAYNNPSTRSFKFRRSKAQQSLTIRKKHWKKAGLIYPMFWDQSNKTFTGKEPLPGKLRFDSKLIKTSNKRFYLCQLTNSSRGQQQKNQACNDQRKEVIAFDPGEKCFLTGYDLTGKVFEFGKSRDGDKLYSLLLKADYWLCKSNQKRHSKNGFLNTYVRTHKRRQQFWKKFCQARTKLNNKIHNLHHCVAKWICQNYKVCFLGNLKVSKIVCNTEGKRKLRKKETRKMLNWSFYKFKMILQDKAMKFKSCKIILAKEHYTSQTCLQCGGLQKVRDIYQCRKCDYSALRDDNGTAGIGIKYLSDNKIL